MTDTTNQDLLYQQNTDFELIELLLPFLNNKSFIDVGAEKGSFTQFLASKGFHGSFFEPLPIFDAELRLIADQTRCQFFPLAVDSKDGSADFYSAFDHADNPLSYFSTMHPLTSDERINHKKATTVTCRSLDSLLSEGLINKMVGVVKIDTEGNDLNVLKGMHNIEAEVLMCEYFMPGIYAGWELGHPQNLIEEAKRLGFKHFIAIKRIDEYEIVSLDDSEFIEKQWGNLIFIRDEILNLAKEKIDNLVATKHSTFIKNVVSTTEYLRKVNNERLEIIEGLKQACEERLALINNQSEEIVLLKGIKQLAKNPYNKFVKLKKYFSTKA